ncbi:hypothetical protein [Pseudomonas panipatensis]|uniref:hypothetical protein n=1 Tax=Pseudomonas panipatensis TaxID=428992 RepID=UPI0035B2B5C6
MKAPILLGLTLLLAGCATTKTDVRNEAAAAKYNPATMARIRIFTSPNTRGHFISGQTCEQFYNVSLKAGREEDLVTQAHTIGPGITGILTSDFRNNVIGMPATAASKQINDTPRYFDEHVVPAGKPLIVRLYFRDSRLICRPPPRVFTPEPGADYEFEYLGTAEGVFSQYTCNTEFRKLDQQGSTTVEIPTETALCVSGPGGIRTLTPPIIPDSSQR